MAISDSVVFFDRTTPPHVITLVLMSGLSALSMNVFLPSLPNMTEYFQADYALIQLSVSAYLGVTGVLQIFIGPISDRFGRRPVVLTGVVVFFLATIGCLLATTIEVFLLFRMLQTAIATGMVLSRAAVRDMHPPNEAASMIGYVTMGMAMVPMIAPAFGGFLDDLYGWKANFSMLLVFGVLIFVTAFFDMGETNKNKSPSFAAQFRAYPELFGSRRFWGYAIVAAAASGSFFAFLGGAPFVGMGYFGLSAFELGLFFGTVSLGYLIGNFFAGRYSSRLGINRMIFYGALVTTGGLSASLIFVLIGIIHPAAFFGFMGFVGVGNGMLLPNATSGMLSVRPHLAGSASGLGGALMLLGGAALANSTSMILTENAHPLPLLILMLCSASIAVLVVFYIFWVDRVAGALGETD